MKGRELLRYFWDFGGNLVRQYTGVTICLETWGICAWAWSVHAATDWWPLQAVPSSSGDRKNNPESNAISLSLLQQQFKRGKKANLIQKKKECENYHILISERVCGRITIRVNIEFPMIIFFCIPPDVSVYWNCG